MTEATWSVQVRRNSDLSIVAVVDDFEELTAIRRFNDVGTWALTLRQESPNAKYFLPDSNRGFPNGLLIYKDNNDGAGPQLFLGGPQRSVQWSRKADSTGPILAGGMCDNYWLNKRLAFTTVDFRYFLDFTPKQHYYEMNEASGATTAIDTGTGLQNGTYHGGASLGVPGLIDDPSTCALFDGSTGYLSVPTTGLNAGNNSWTIGCWGMLTGTPGANNCVAASLGTTNVAKENVAIQVNSSLAVQLTSTSLTTQTGPTVKLNTPHMFVITYDGTTLTGWLDGVAFGTITTGGLSLTFGNANFGAYIDNTHGFWIGNLAHAFIDNAFHPLADVQRWWLIGNSRMAFNEFATYNKPDTTNNIFDVVDQNCGPAANPPIRIIPNINMPTYYAHLGAVNTGTWLARFDSILLFIKVMALASTPEVGFQLVQVLNQLEFHTFLPVDRTATAIFSLDRGNLMEYDINYQAGDANYLLAGGRNGNSTSLSSRMFGQGQDNTSISRFGYLEGFLDYRQSSDSVSIGTVIAAKLLELAQKRSINATLIDTPALYYLGPGSKGYQIGDKVSVVTEQGTIFNDLVREVKVELATGKPSVITPAIGTPLTAEIISEFDTLMKRLRGDDAFVAQLQANY